MLRGRRASLTRNAPPPPKKSTSALRHRPDASAPITSTHPSIHPSERTSVFLHMPEASAHATAFCGEGKEGGRARRMALMELSAARAVPSTT